jgi:ribonuclease HII
MGSKLTTPGTRPRLKPPNDRLERSMVSEGFPLVAGLDEVGRGAWAGPVSVGVVVHAFDRRPPKGIRDSKLLSEPRREELYPQVAAWCTEWAVGHAGPQECDALGMTRALRLAARRALAELSVVPQVVLMDGGHDYVTEPDPGPDPDRDAGPGPDAAVHPAVHPAVHSAADSTGGPTPEVRTVVRGDATCLSIAAASILAKVTRDRMMRSWAESFPPFDFDRNKGYPSRSHRTALSGFGLTSIHRRSWSFVDDLAFR